MEKIEISDLELSKSYEPAPIENRWYDIWEKSGYFTPKCNGNKKTYSIVIPPPNVTGQLHMGHAFNNTIQDILARFKRMQGYDTLWLPGTDHAGIATQNVVEKALLSQKLNRHILGREKFVEKVWEWKNEYGNKIISQLKKLGASCDWTRLRFTMDNGLSEAVKEVFIRLFNEGLIYRGNYIVNWCPRCETALADDEVDHRELDGAFYYIKYFFKDSEEYVIIATTRPETMLGDTAVAAHPSDDRYKNQIGKTLILPLLNREIKFIADNYVDPEFGTGALKITPAHDPNDFLIGKKHKLEEINIFTNNAVINENGGKYCGLDRFKARKKIIEDLKEQGYLLKIEPIKHKVGHCYRCNTAIEPYISKQWFVKMQPLAEPAIKAVKDGRITFHPKNWENTYFDWLEKVRDWCISRQIWWGHRIPVWYCSDCDNIMALKQAPTKCLNCNSVNIEQDTDVLDTWFSSALWPFSTLGWPEETKDLKLFYPTSTLSTGFDIIFFWVARMIIMGLHFMDDAPFRDVYIHGLIRTETGAKMSKSSGNAIDPLELINNYGCDAMRFTLTALAAQGRDIKLSPARLEGYRHFLNKIWNAARFVFLNLTQNKELSNALQTPENLINNNTAQYFDLSDKWILFELNKTIDEYTADLETFRFNEAANCIYEFIWRKFCDWYIELSKPKLSKGTNIEKQIKLSILLYCLDNSLRLLHPITPFITEEIWQKLPKQFKDAETIMLANWSKANIKFSQFAQDYEQMQKLIEIITNIRNVASQMKIPISQKIPVVLIIKNAELKKIVYAFRSYIELLAKTESLQIADDYNIDNTCGVAALQDITIIALTTKKIDVAAERLRIEKLIADYTKDLEKTNAKLNNQQFLEKAPAQVIEKEKKKKNEFESILAELQNTLKNLED